MNTQQTIPMQETATQAAAQPKPQTPAKPRRVPARQRTIEDIYNDLKDELKTWVRSAAAYAVLSDALNSRKGGDAQAGDRQRAAPLLHTPPISFAGEQIELVLDPNKCRPEEFEFALIPFINAQIGPIKVSLDRMSALVMELRVAQNLSPMPEQTPVVEHQQ